MKRIIAFIACLSIALMPSCSTPGTGSATTQPQPQNIRNGAAAAAAVAFAVTPPEDQPRLAADLGTAVSALKTLGGAQITSAEISRIITDYIGNARPEYVVLATIAADYLPLAVSSSDLKAKLLQLADGINLVAAAYAK